MKKPVLQVKIFVDRLYLIQVNISKFFIIIEQFISLNPQKNSLE
jgi:hypothetical protein